MKETSSNAGNCIMTNMCCGFINVAEIRPPGNELNASVTELEGFYFACSCQGQKGHVQKFAAKKVRNHLRKWCQAQ